MSATQSRRVASRGRPLSVDERLDYPTFFHLLRWRAAHQGTKQAYAFLTDGEGEEVTITYEELDRQARAIAAALQKIGAAGERALLLYPPGLDFIAGLFGCWYAGVIGVPVYPPDPRRLSRTLPRLQSVVSDAGATVALTTTLMQAGAEMVFEQAPSLRTLRWFTTDSIVAPVGQPVGWQAPSVDSETIAFLQYTSGSTAAPKGVMVTHANFLHNSSLVQEGCAHDTENFAVTWLPHFHDMGLMFILQPMFLGTPSVLMSPLAFLQQPIRWLRAVSRYRAKTSGGPNFAYDLCVDKTTAEQRRGLDLTSWTIAYNAAEPIRAATLDRFMATFGPFGFRREAFYPCYGLAEATLIVSGSQKGAPPVLQGVDAQAMAQHRVVPRDATEPGPGRVLVSSGKPLCDQRVVIVDPETLTPAAPDAIGEIWVAGPSVARGYWNRPEESRRTFHASLAGESERSFLRTGDLGFFRGDELFITGRHKDLIIIRGENYYPQDLEQTAEESHPALRRGCCAAFSFEIDQIERLGIVQEVDKQEAVKYDDVISSIRQAVTEDHGVRLDVVILIEPKSIPKTSSGKIQRHSCRSGFLAGALEVVAEWRAPIARQPAAAAHGLVTHRSAT